jgi:repressor LexA
MNATEFRYCAQAPLPPIFRAASNTAMRYKTGMLDFVFDKEAVRVALATKGISHERFADAIGLTHKSAVAKILNGTRRVKVEEAARIYQELGLIAVAHRGTRSIPLIGFASAGSWREAVEMPQGRMIVPEQVAGKRAFAVEVQGDSMNQLIDDGGWIVIDPDDKVLVPGKSYLIQTEEYEVTVKRYCAHPAQFEPVSDNPAHKPFLAADQDFAVLGRVVWKGSYL